MSVIKSIIAREILDSRGNPTVEVEVKLENNLKVKSAVPSGASTGTHEALELRDGDEKRYGGKGVLKAVENVNSIIAPKLIGIDPQKQEEIDKIMLELDGTENKSNLGANAILGVSLAVARAGALDAEKPLYMYLKNKYWSDKEISFPTPMMNVMNGGTHADWATDIQEFMLVPQQKKIEEAIRCGAEIFHCLKKVLQEKKYSTNVGDEGGYAPKLSQNNEALDLMLLAIEKAGYKAGENVKLGIDSASSEFFKDGEYDLKSENRKINSEELIAMYKNWTEKYPIELIEDGLAEDDWEGWKKITTELGGKIILIGDDLFVTNSKIVKKGIDEKVANAVLIKPNQIGSLTETIECMKLAQKNNYKLAVSHRSGETVDDFIADLAIASGAEYLKTGSLCRGERVAKYNRLMEIWEETRVKSL